MTEQADALMRRVRPIEPEDYHKGYVRLFSTLTHCEELTEEEFIEIIDERKKAGWLTWVIEAVDEPLIVATISVSFERKIYRGGKYVGHIEDVIVLPEYQHHKLGTHLNEFAIQECEEFSCYKVILDCEESLEEFYNKAGLKKSNIQMAKYF